ncbi:MAG: NAD(P)-dependent oxidoreductase [Anaerolineales bacterium]|nr:NAD(P)-dependent oxidoreductase [Anaerolineales bacterium]
MNILITGNLSSLAVPLAKEFVKEKNKVILASYNVDKIDLKLSNVILHSINPAERIFRDALSSYKPDVIIYLSTREEQLDDIEDEFHAGQQLDGLKSALELSKKGNIRRFIFVSSTEVYGDMTESSEGVVPEPSSINGYSLSLAERYCRIYRDEFDLNLTILRLPYVYGPDEKSGLFFRLIRDGNQKNEILLPDSPDTRCSFLHVEDVVDFVKRAIDDEYSIESLVVNLSSSKPMKYADLENLLSKYYAKVTCISGEKRTVYTRPVAVSAAKRQFDWYEVHNLADEIGEFVDVAPTEVVKKPSVLSSLFDRLSRHPTFLKWTELILGGLAAIYLSQLTGTLIQFQYVDFRLVYVVIMGSIYGLQFGLYSSVIVSLFVLYTWLGLGVDWKLLVYNVGNWFPFVMYFAVGLITGYNHDKTENNILYSQKQYDLVLDKYSFLYEVFNEIRDLKDEFRERLIGYRDSFGKIFTITRELDELQEHAVYFRALNILEELMDNKNIAIYSLDSNRAYARLEVNSAEMSRTIAKSLKLSDYPAALDSIEQGKIFQNSSLLENYPAYIAPVLNNSYPFNVPVAMIVIWTAEFDQYSTYYYNLFKVICGMIEASLVRATLFLDANYDRMYLPATRILNHDAFIDTLKVRLEMKKNKIAEFQVIALQESEVDVQKKYAKISLGIRSADVVGILRNGSSYILLSQADKQASLEVVERLEKLGVKGRLIEANEVPMG